MVTYSDTPSVVFYLNTYNNGIDMRSALSFDPSSGGKTNTQAALKLVNDDVFISPNGDRANVDNVVVLITDGYSNIQQVYMHRNQIYLFV